eukprot:SAG22_NODE_2471_length_2534_cov_1.657495_1_plen_364_part_00
MVAHDGREPRRLRDLLNALLMVAVIVPPALLTAQLRHYCTEAPPPSAGAGAAADAWGLGLQWLGQLARRPAGLAAAPDEASCLLYRAHPLLLVNLIYFAAVDVGLYAIYLLQGSTWLIDPHWQLIPMSIAAFWFTHPDSNPAAPRALLALGLLYTWAARLLHNYLRREGWHFGLGEDWRYADMRRAHGRLWVLTQFFAVSVAQHGMLVGLTLPLQPAMAADAAPLNAVDVAAVAVCVAGLAIGCTADNQLREYMLMAPDAKPIILQTGLWRYSRHPNHFGEQLWWVGLLLLGVAANPSVTALWPIGFGVLFNHSLDIFATLPLIEGRMLRKAERAGPFREYQHRTSLLVPMPRRRRGRGQKVE